MKLRGSFRPTGDKSISHRIALMALLGKGRCAVQNFSSAEDPLTTLRVVAALGVPARRSGSELMLEGIQSRLCGPDLIHCGNSGTTLRLLMGILSGVEGERLLDGDDSLRRRPMERVALPLREMGARIHCDGGSAPVRIQGGALQGIRYTLPVPSAQLKSAVLLAGIQAQGATLVKEPVPSRDHTERLLSLCHVEIERDDEVWRVVPSTPRLPRHFYVPGDVSSAAFLLCAAVVGQGSEVEAEGVLLNPLRCGFLEVLRRMGADVEIELWGEEPEPWGRIRARFSPNLVGCEVSPSEVPQLVDEIPILALVATQARGPTRFRSVGELRLKESDRLSAIATQLGAMGAEIRIEGDDLVIEGPTSLRPVEELDSFRDHRMAMTLRIAAMLTGAEPRIKGEESVRISYPEFHETLRRLAS